MQSIQTVLLTGATGFVGRELLWRLARLPHIRVHCLIRSQDSAGADRRLHDVLDNAQPSPLTPEERSRCAAIAGDLTLEKLGLTSEQWKELASSVTRIVHGAASVDWAMPLNVARSINVQGTSRVIELAQEAHARGVLQAFDYISTCNVCGRRRGVVPETDLDASHGFFNHYERSKFEAEQLVRASRLPYCIFRLSMVVGDSHTGYASTFKVMYWPLKMLSRGLAWAVPADKGGIIDLVPVDYVCDALEALAADRSQRGKTFHIAAGPGRSSTIAEMLALAVRSFKVRAPLLIPPVLFSIAIRPVLFLVVWGKRRRLLQKGKVYRPYFSYGAIFDTTQVRTALEPAGIKPPLVQDYFQKLIDYAIASNWNRTEV
jgi:thioester reductase-like protein